MITSFHRVVAVRGMAYAITSGLYYGPNSIHWSYLGLAKSLEIPITDFYLRRYNAFVPGIVSKLYTILAFASNNRPGADPHCITQEVYSLTHALTQVLPEDQDSFLETLAKILSFSSFSQPPGNIMEPNPQSNPQSNPSASIPPSLTSALTELEQKLLATDPQIPSHLRNIHTLLRSYPESIVLLTDSQIKTLIDAASQVTQVFIVEKQTNREAKTTSRAKKLDASLF